MSKKKKSRNAPCPCGSGKKYKHCCFKWELLSTWKHLVHGMLLDARKILQKQEGRDQDIYFSVPEWKSALKIVSKGDLQKIKLTEDDIISFARRYAMFKNERRLNKETEKSEMYYAVVEEI